MRGCHYCGGHEFDPVLDFGEQPISHRLLNNATDAEYVHGLALRYCVSCGLVQIVDPIPPDELYTDYNWLSTWKPQRHLPELVEWVKALPGLSADGLIVEVGSNDGMFLEALRDAGYHRVLGLEPARDAREAAVAKGIETLSGYLTPDAARRIVASHGQCRLFIARHVLEHVPDLATFGEAMSILLAPDGYVLIEVPYFQKNLETTDYSLIWEEHTNYFTDGTIQRFLADYGVQVRRRGEFLFSGEALAVLGERTGAAVKIGTDGLARTRELVATYRANLARFRDACVALFDDCRARGEDVVVYGAGVRAHAFLNFVGLASYVRFIVDDQPEKQGKFFPGARLAIKPSSALDELGPALCLLAVNAENEETVIARHAPFEARGGRFASVCPPSHRLLPVWSELR
jgi:SAM-dependent methyltransferase